MSVGLDLHLEGVIRTIVWVRREIFKSESEAVDLWQPKWNENQTVVAVAIVPWTGTQFP